MTSHETITTRRTLGVAVPENLVNYFKELAANRNSVWLSLFLLTVAGATFPILTGLFSNHRPGPALLTNLRLVLIPLLSVLVTTVFCFAGLVLTTGSASFRAVLAVTGRTWSWFVIASTAIGLTFFTAGISREVADPLAFDIFSLRFLAGAESSFAVVRLLQSLDILTLSHAWLLAAGLGSLLPARTHHIATPIVFGGWAMVTTVAVGLKWLVS